MQITKENVDMLKPGMLALVSGRLLRFVRIGARPHEVYFEKIQAKPGDGHFYYDLDWYEPMILIGEEG